MSSVKEKLVTGGRNRPCNSEILLMTNHVVLRHFVLELNSEESGLSD